MEGRATEVDTHAPEGMDPNSSVSVIVVTVNTLVECGSDRIPEQGNPQNEKTSYLDEKTPKDPDAMEMKIDGCVIDVRDEEVEKGGLGSKDLGNDKVCRICHLSSDHHNASEVIELGCECKDDLGAAHRHCAEAWFKIKGNTRCEICSEIAKNITGIGDRAFLEEWNAAEVHRNSPRVERGGCWRGQRFCNFLMGCIVLAFVLPWFFRVNLFP